MRTPPSVGSISDAYERYGSPSFVASAAPTTPPCPSDVSAPAKTRSNDSLRRAAVRTSTVARVSEPLSVSSATCTALAAPIASALRSASVAPAGPMVSTVTSPPCASVSLSAFSSRYSSLPFASSSTERSVSRSLPRRSVPTTGTALSRTRMFKQPPPFARRRLAKDAKTGPPRRPAPLRAEVEARSALEIYVQVRPDGHADALHAVSRHAVRIDERADGHCLAVAVVAVEDADVADALTAMRPDDEITLLGVAGESAVTPEVVVVAGSGALAADAIGESLLAEGPIDKTRAVIAAQPVGTEPERLVQLGGGEVQHGTRLGRSGCSGDWWCRLELKAGDEN